MNRAHNSKKTVVHCSVKEFSMRDTQTCCLWRPVFCILTQRAAHTLSDSLSHNNYVAEPVHLSGLHKNNLPKHHTYTQPTSDNLTQSGPLFFCKGIV